MYASRASIIHIILPFRSIDKRWGKDYSQSISHLGVTDINSRRTYPRLSERTNPMQKYIQKKNLQRQIQLNSEPSHLVIGNNLILDVALNCPIL